MLSGDYSLAYSLLEGLHDTAFSVQYNAGLAAFQAKKYAEALSLAEALVKKAKGKDRADVCRLAGKRRFRPQNNGKRPKSGTSNSRAWKGNDPVVQYNCAVASYNLGEIDVAWGYYKRRSNESLFVKQGHREQVCGPTPRKPRRYGGRDSLDALYNDAVGPAARGKKTRKRNSFYKKS